MFYTHPAFHIKCYVGTVFAVEITVEMSVVLTYLHFCQSVHFKRTPSTISANIVSNGKKLVFRQVKEKVGFS